MGVTLTLGSRPRRQLSRSASEMPLTTTGAGWTPGAGIGCPPPVGPVWAKDGATLANAKRIDNTEGTNLRTMSVLLSRKRETGSNIPSPQERPADRCRLAHNEAIFADRRA